MTLVTIKVFHAIDNQRALVRTIHIQPDSKKALTGSRALKILCREFPELGYVHSLNKSEDGWHHCRALEPKLDCPFHYKWEHFYVSQEP